MTATTIATTPTSANDTVPAAAGRGLAASSLAVARRTVRKFLRTPQLIVMSTVQGVLFLLHLPLRLRRRHRRRRHQLRRLPRPRVHHHHHPVRRHGRGGGRRRGHPVRVRRPAPLAAHPPCGRGGRPGHRRHRPARLDARRHHRRRLRDRVPAVHRPRPRAGRLRAVRRCSASRSSGCSSRWASSPATRRRRRACRCWCSH